MPNPANEDKCTSVRNVPTDSPSVANKLRRPDGTEDESETESRLQSIGVATVCYKEAKRNRRAATATRVDRVSNWDNSQKIKENESAAYILIHRRTSSRT